ncbi:hypothetical protein CDAR_250881 [Caerostris darwini]|uniref:Secreted protein n=1 Tax=Caerostris darwini TaxID=1538125 RepID=A0AAV4TNN5_9ARAC|nr:hypothetical protein CDAR_250881 [Caerostris darwini]
MKILRILFFFHFVLRQKNVSNKSAEEEKKSVRIHPCNLGRRELDTHSNAAWNVSDGRTRGKKGEGRSCETKLEGSLFFSPLRPLSLCGNKLISKKRGFAFLADEFSES